MYKELLLSHEQVIEVFKLAVEKSKVTGPFAIAICDVHGDSQGFLRMDGVNYASINMASFKAKTAAKHGHDTKSLGQWILDHKYPVEFLADSTFAGFGGGVPIKVGEKVMGGIGISGLQESQDIALAQEILAALNLEAQ